MITEVEFKNYLRRCALFNDYENSHSLNVRILFGNTFPGAFI